MKLRVRNHVREDTQKPGNGTGEKTTVQPPASPTAWPPFLTLPLHNLGADAGSLGNKAVQLLKRAAPTVNDHKHNEGRQERGGNAVSVAVLPFPSRSLPLWPILQSSHPLVFGFRIGSTLQTFEALQSAQIGLPSSCNFEKYIRLRRTG